MASSSSSSLLRVDRIGHSLVVHIRDCEVLNDATMPAVKGEILALVEEHRPATLDLYMANIRLLSSNALSMLLALNRKLQSAGCHLNLHGVNPTIRELLDVTHLSRVLDVR